MINLLEFGSETAYTAALGSEDFVRPNVSYVVESDAVHYNPKVTGYRVRYVNNDTTLEVRYFNEDDIVTVPEFNDYHDYWEYVENIGSIYRYYDQDKGYGTGWTHLTYQVEGDNTVGDATVTNEPLYMPAENIEIVIKIEK